MGLGRGFEGRVGNTFFSFPTENGKKNLNYYGFQIDFS
jgi:hypothetical protein